MSSKKDRLEKEIAEIEARLADKRREQELLAQREKEERKKDDEKTTFLIGQIALSAAKERPSIRDAIKLAALQLTKKDQQFLKKSLLWSEVFGEFSVAESTPAASGLAESKAPESEPVPPLDMGEKASIKEARWKLQFSPADNEMRNKLKAVGAKYYGQDDAKYWSLLSTSEAFADFVTQYPPTSIHNV